MPDGVRPEDIARLRREIEHESRSSLELLLEGHDETGDANNDLGFLRYGARVNARVGPDTSLHLFVRRTPYSTQENVIEESGLSFGVGARSKPSERIEYRWELGGTRFSSDAWSVTGLLGVTLHPRDGLSYTLSAGRSNVEESMLSAVGLRPALGPFAGERVGPVADTRASAGLAWQPLGQLDLVAEAAAGVRSGSHVGSNGFVRLGGGPGWNAVTRGPDSAVSLVRLGAWIEYFAFADDRLGYGGASVVGVDGRPLPAAAIGGDGISPEPSPSNPGVGGYFSPANFLSAVARIELRGRPQPSFEYRVSGALGQQSFTGSEARRAAGLAATVTLNRQGRVSFPLSYAWDDYGPFKQQSFQARLVLLF